MAVAGLSRTIAVQAAGREVDHWGAAGSAAGKVREREKECLAREVLALLRRPASFGATANQRSPLTQGSSARGSTQAGEQFPGPAD